MTKLNQFFATAICGNDILSSALYVSGVAILFAGVYAPLVFLFIALVLFFYKSVYTEVVEALPVNGGAYNCLLNASSKTFAAIAGVMTILSYIATAVLSGNVGVEYLSNMIHVPVIPTTIPMNTPIWAESASFFKFQILHFCDILLARLRTSR